MRFEEDALCKFLLVVSEENSHTFNIVMARCPRKLTHKSAGQLERERLTGPSKLALHSRSEDVFITRRSILYSIEQETLLATSLTAVYFNGTQKTVAKICIWSVRGVKSCVGCFRTAIGLLTSWSQVAIYFRSIWDITWLKNDKIRNSNY